MEITILRLYDLIIEYCQKHSKAVVYYEMKYINEEEKEDILSFYKDKLPIEIYESLKYDDDNFIAFNKVETALDYAETIFPYKPQIVEIDPKYFIFCCVFNENGEFMWDNSN